jgi:reactive chlorine resistance protein C
MKADEMNCLWQTPWSPKASALGGALAILMFLTTLSFIFSTLGWEPSLDGFPALSAMPGQFLLKDVVLLGAAIWSLAARRVVNLPRHAASR